MTMAERAVAEFNKTNCIPNRGQRILHAMGPGDVHIFPDGSLAVHWSDDDFSVGEMVDDDTVP